MSVQNLYKLEALIKREREVLLLRWREQVSQLPSAKNLDTPTLNDHIPHLLDELVSALQEASDQTIPEAMLEGSAPNHGLQRHEDGYDIVEVVAEYNILRDCIIDLADGNAISLQGKAFHILNRVLDESIGLAVQTFATQQTVEIQRQRDEYLAFVAHDLRTPLNAIYLAAHVLESTFKSENDGGEIAEIVEILRHNVGNLRVLVENVLKESAHIQSDTGVNLECREFDAWPFVEILLHNLHPIAEIADTRLINTIPKRFSVYADASLLSRVIQNLITNAIKYTPRGEIIIGARETGANGAVEFWVTDNGAGIPEDRLERIFNKLETDPDRRDGIGLGLSIVKTFVKAHGGEVTVESKEGVGSTFRFSLPGRQNSDS